MKKQIFILLASAFLAAPAFAEEATTTTAPAVTEAAAPAASESVRVREGQTIYAADDSRLGVVYRFSSSTATVRASGGRFLSVPISGLSRQNGHVVSDMTREQVLAAN